MVNATPVSAGTPSPTGKLNDTGITLCGDYAFGNSGNHDNNLSCNLTTDDEGDPVPLGQDGVTGRDANTATNNDNDGHKGFSFTKLSSNGSALANQNSTTFSCVKDNVTGLIWEVKQTATGLHNKDDVYTWFNTDAATNGGNSGTVNTNASCEGKTNNTCNTQAYVVRVNKASLCGATNWRLPTRKELGSLTRYGLGLGITLSFSAIDTTYFPNTKASPFFTAATDEDFYWMSSPLASTSDTAWYIDYRHGYSFSRNKSDSGLVRLVRSER